MLNLPEEWRTVPNFPHYEASSHGRVRSLDRMVATTHHGWSGMRRLRGRVLKPANNRGYLVVGLAEEGESWTYGVHQVVAMAFHGLPPAGMVVDHVDTNKHNNVPSNLEYVTGSENTKRQYKTGLLCNNGEAHGNCKVSDADAEVIRQSKGKITAIDLALRFKVSDIHIRRIWNRQCRV